MGWRNSALTATSKITLTCSFRDMKMGETLLIFKKKSFSVLWQRKPGWNVQDSIWGTVILKKKTGKKNHPLSEQSHLKKVTGTRIRIACDASVNQLYVNNISNNNDTISHRYYPVIKMGNNRISVGVLRQETTHWVSLYCTCLIWLRLWMWLWKRVTQTSQECWHPPGPFLQSPPDRAGPLMLL